MRIRPDELPDFVYKEDESVVFSFRVKILLHPLAEVLDAEGKVFLSAVDPLLSRLGALVQSLGERLDNLITVKFVGISFGNPLVGSMPFLVEIANGSSGSCHLFEAALQMRLQRGSQAEQVLVATHLV